MCEPPSYDTIERGDRTGRCPFCGRADPGEPVDYEDWWGATECGHVCCCGCLDCSGDHPLCPRCAEQERERNGQPT